MKSRKYNSFMGVAPKKMKPFYSTCLVVLSFIISYCSKETVAHASNPIPYGWEKMCTLSDGSNILRQYVDAVMGDVYYLHCQVRNHDAIAWRYSTLRDWLHDIPGISVFVRVECENGASISLPWPMRARGVVGLSIYNCILRDKFSEFQDKTISVISDHLRVLEIQNSFWFSDNTIFKTMTNPASLANLTEDYECGQDSTIEYMMSSNISYITDLAPGQADQKIPDSGTVDVGFGSMPVNNKNSLDVDNPMDNSVLLEALKGGGGGDKLSTMFGGENFVSLPATRMPDNATDEFLKLTKTFESLDLKCNYLKLRVVGESYPEIMITNYFKFMLQSAKYPEVRVMNYTRSGIREFPQELKDHRLHFPKLEFLDLSHNQIKNIDLGAQTQSLGHVIIDLRSNLIANVTLDDVIAWSKIHDVFVDIRKNPIHCDCNMEPLLDRVQTKDFFVGELAPYAYLRDMECATPEALQGRKLQSVNLDCGRHARASLDSSGWTTTYTWAIAGCSAFGLVSTLAVVAVVLRLKTGRHRSSSGHKNLPKTPEGV